MNKHKWSEDQKSLTWLDPPCIFSFKIQFKFYLLLELSLTACLCHFFPWEIINSPSIWQVACTALCFMYAPYLFSKTVNPSRTVTKSHFCVYPQVSSIMHCTQQISVFTGSNPAPQHGIQGLLWCCSYLLPQSDHPPPSHNLPYHNFASLLMPFAWKVLPIFVFHLANAHSSFNTWIHHHPYQEALPDCFLPSNTLSEMKLPCVSMGFIVDLGFRGNRIIWWFVPAFSVPWRMLGIGDIQ